MAHRIYLDACALGRLFDLPAEPRVRKEFEAMQTIFRMIAGKEIDWNASTTLVAEIRRNRNDEDRMGAMALLSFASKILELESTESLRAVTLHQVGYGATDAIHLAIAEASTATLLTTDDRFLKRARRGVGTPLVRVVNPVEWLREVNHAAYTNP